MQAYFFNRYRLSRFYFYEAAGTNLFLKSNPLRPYVSRYDTSRGLISLVAIPLTHLTLMVGFAVGALGHLLRSAYYLCLLNIRASFKCAHAALVSLFIAIRSVFEGAYETLKAAMMVTTKAIATFVSAAAPVLHGCAVAGKNLLFSPTINEPNGDKDPAVALKMA